MWHGAGRRRCQWRRQWRGRRSQRRVDVHDGDLGQLVVTVVVGWWSAAATGIHQRGAVTPMDCTGGIGHRGFLARELLLQTSLPHTLWDGQKAESFSLSSF